MKVIITGTTGMVGEGVLLECLDNPRVSQVLSVSRRPTGMSHPKLKELLVPDFLALPARDGRLQGYDACFFCAGVTSVGKAEPDFTVATYDTTMAFARAIGPNPQLTFIYVSGAGTDSTEKGRTMWARVKGKTENDLRKLGFRQALAFRPGVMEATKGQTRLLKLYKYMAWLLPVMKAVAPSSVLTLRQVGQAMVEAGQNGYEKDAAEIKDIAILAERAKGRR